MNPEQAAEELLRRKKARQSILEFSRYVAIEPEPALHHQYLLNYLQEVVMGRIRRLMVFMPPGCAKALAVDTPIPTPNGWTPIGELERGDQVFDENGAVCNVTWKSPYFINRPVYEVKTDCGDSIIADQDHEWRVRLCGKRPVFKTKETWELSRVRSKRPMIERAKALDSEKTDLPVDPYVLGYWLGDGSSNQPTITCSETDMPFVREEIERRGVQTSTRKSPIAFGLLGIRGALVALGVLNNKHIPSIYMRAGKDQRLDLLRGLIDSDGTVSKASGTTTFCNVNRALAKQVRELVRSLGVKAGWSETPAMLNGKNCGTAYRVSFYLADAALLPRKRELARDQTRTPNTYIDAGRVQNKTTVCIEVDSPSHLYLAGESMTPTHNSTYCSVILPAYYLGMNPERRVIAASYDTSLSTLFGSRVRSLVSMNDDYRALFPNMNLSQDTKAKGEWNLEGHTGGYYATGVGSAVTGRRGHLAILDDLVKGRAEADSARVMESTWHWLMSDLYTRLIPQVNSIIYITTRWAQNDPAGRLLPDDWDGESGKIRCHDGDTWHVICLPAQAGKKDPIGRKEGEWLWPEWYTPEEWKKIKAAQMEAGTRNWSALYQQNPTPEEGTYFKREWFKWYTPETQPRRMTHYEAGDFAVSQDRGDFTEVGVFGVDQADNLYVAPDHGWWNGQETADIWIDRLLDFAEFFKPHAFISEKGVIRNAVEPYLDKRMDERRVYVVKEWLAHIGDKTANARAFQARAANGKVYLPDNDIGRRILNQLLEFPAGKHDDIVDVCGLMGRYLQMSTVPVEKKQDLTKRDRWAKAFERADSTQVTSWKVA